MNALEGRVGSIVERWGKQDETDHSSFQSFFSFALWPCLRAGMLRGSCSLRAMGSLFLGLDLASPFAANFTSLSATSLPSTSSCPAIHLTVTSSLLLSFFPCRWRMRFLKQRSR